MKAITRVFRFTVIRRRSFFAGLIGLTLAMAVATFGRAEEIPATVEMEITRLAPPWGAPSYHLEGPYFIKIKNKGPYPLTIPVKGRTTFPVGLQEIVVRPGITEEYIFIPHRINEFGPSVLFIYSVDRIL